MPKLRQIIKLAAKTAAYGIPGGRFAWDRTRDFLAAKPEPDFSGWGMTTFAYPPWVGEGLDEISRGFSRAHERILADVVAGRFTLSQFDSKAMGDKDPILKELMWRHYVVFWSASYAARMTRARQKNLVECGVCDGLTVSFAMLALQGHYDFRTFLYDAWQAMRRDLLLDNELGHCGDYAFLSMNTTKQNLHSFEDRVIFNRGYIPEVFESATNPSEVTWLHIDLNSSVPTTAALVFFFDQVAPGGVILFDDYAWHCYESTRLAVDEFFKGKSGILLPLPTGQAIYFKN